MIIQEQSNLFSLQRFPTVDDNFGFVPFSVKVATQGFSGEIHDIDVEIADLQSFLNQLRILEEKRQGSATLASSDIISEWGRFRVECFSVDKLGHMGLSVELLKSEFGKLHRPLQLAVSFEIDPSNLPYLLKEFTDLVNSLKKNAS